MKLSVLIWKTRRSSRPSFLCLLRPAPSLPYCSRRTLRRALHSPSFAPWLSRRTPTRRCALLTPWRSLLPTLPRHLPTPRPHTLSQATRPCRRLWRRPLHTQMGRRSLLRSSSLGHTCSAPMVRCPLRRLPRTRPNLSALPGSSLREWAEAVRLPRARYRRLLHWTLSSVPTSLYLRWRSAPRTRSRSSCRSHPRSSGCATRSPSASCLRPAMSPVWRCEALPPRSISGILGLGMSVRL